MTHEKINQKYLKKIKLFQKYNKHYYNLNKPLVSDQIFDKLKFEILDLEKKYDFLHHKDSPKISVGGISFTILATFWARNSVMR